MLFEQVMLMEFICFYHKPTDDEQWYAAQIDMPANTPGTLFDECDDYCNTTVVHTKTLSDAFDTCANFHTQLSICVNPHQIKLKVLDYRALHPCFGWVSADIVQHT